ncbi:DUF58 domain-containing protein [Halonatronum saccharophilum]|uniref:DUF58 domain-containing protein n=1 Tax=Halonatronum saccharophilum TaxID=150060 RepID=UPI00048817D1|nr:DUF58 domain-containing protein [Halonatronum saccharophilum]
MRGYIIFVAVVSLIALVSGLLHLFSLVYITLALILLFKYINKKAFENLEVKRELSKDRIFRGEESLIRIQIKNKGIWPIFWLAYNVDVPVKLALPLKTRITSLLPKGEIDFEYKLDGKRRGLYKLGKLSLEIGDPLDFNVNTTKYDDEVILIVYPNIFALDSLGLPSRIAFGDTLWPQRIYQDPSSFRGLREYQLGDPLKDVYWPATASSGKMMVKEYESTVTIQNMIFLNLDLQDYDIRKVDLKKEFAIEVVASIAHYLTRVDQIIGFGTNGKDLVNEINLVRPAQGDGQLMKIMELLACLDFSEGDSFLDTIDEGYKHLSPGSTVILISEIDTEELVKKALELCHKGLNVVIILVGGEVLHPEYLNRAYTESLVIYKVNRRNDLYNLASGVI